MQGIAHKSSIAVDTLAASAGTTLATVPVDQLLIPLQNIAVGVSSALILRGFAWIASKLSGK